MKTAEELVGKMETQKGQNEDAQKALKKVSQKVALMVVWKVSEQGNQMAVVMVRSWVEKKVQMKDR